MRVFLWILLTFSTLIARSEIPSPIPPAYETWIDLDISACDEVCLNELIKKREFASFMAKYSPQSHTSKEFLRTYNAIKWGLNLSKKEKIAVILPKTLKSYAKAIKTSIEAYIVSHESALSAYFIHCQNESEIKTAIKKARELGANLFIAPVKENGLMLLASELKDNEVAYIPTLSPTKILSNGRIIFGGISYKEQIAMLAQQAQSQSAIFSDNSDLARKLDEIINEVGVKITNHIKINSDEASIKTLEDRAETLNNSNIFLNLPLIKVAFAVNYLPKFEIKPKMLLSTQIGYNPQVFSLISPLAMGEMIVASSIDEVDKKLKLAGELLGNGGWYNWVSYSCALGFERLSQKYVDVIDRMDFKEQFVANRVLYTTRLYRLEKAGFMPLVE